MKFKTGNKKVRTISVDNDLWIWIQKYAGARGLSASAVVEAQLQKLKDQNHGIYLADGDVTSDLYK